jgi:hypothetical protein
MRLALVLWTYRVEAPFWTHIEKVGRAIVMLGRNCGRAPKVFHLGPDVKSSA